MSKAGSAIRTPSSAQKTPKRRKCTDPVEVACRVRPLPGSPAKCVEQLSETTLKITAPAGSQGFRSNPVSLFYTFNTIFNEQDGQKSVFDKLALPMVEDLIRGKNGLLFAYGVTSSGKTHTMIGQANSPGVLPRCLDVIFNTIGENQARPFIFLPDDNNGMKIQPEYQAALMKNQKERQKRTEERLKKRDGRPDTPDSMKGDEIRIPDSTRLDCVNEDCAYAVFISYVEVYNNYIFDLLEEDQTDQYGHPVIPESKKVGEDSRNRVMYVKDTVEVEVKSTEEACLQMWRGQERRRKAATILNDRSSRSHSVFNIRIVQAPYDEEGKQILLNKEMITISQLSLVDLAGSERASKSHATGGVLKEAGNINSSLMTLHTCLETLRANQLAGRNIKMVPYRESKVTLLFKNFFEGSGKVKMVVCVNPRAEDYDENVHVMKFAELTQDVQVARGQEVQFDENTLAPGRRKNNLLYKRVSEASSVGDPLVDITNFNKRHSFGFNLPAVPPAFNMPPFPSWTAQDGGSEDKIQAVLAALHERQKMKKDALSDFEKRKQRMRAVLLQMEKENEELLTSTTNSRSEVAGLRQENEAYREELSKLEKDCLKLKRENDKLKKEKALYSFERRQVLDDKKKTEDKIRREVEKREIQKKTFKKVVQREKQKWEMNAEQIIRQADLRESQKDSKLRQVLEIVGGNPDVLPHHPKLQLPHLDDIIIPSSSSAPSEDGTTAERDTLGYTLPFSHARRYLEQIDEGSVSPGFLSPTCPSSLGGSQALSSRAPSTKAPSTKAGSTVRAPFSKPPSTRAGSTKASSTKVPSHRTPSSKAASSVTLDSPHKPPVGGVKVLPDSPAAPGLLSPHKSPHTPASLLSHTPASHHASHHSSKKLATNPAPRPKVPTPAPSMRPLPASSPDPSPPGPSSRTPLSRALECEIILDERPALPLRTRMPKNIEGEKWLNHRPVENLNEVAVLKPKFEQKKTVSVPEVDHFDNKTNRYLLQHQEQDSLGEIRTHFIKGEIKVSRGGGRCVEFTDIETTSKMPSAADAFGTEVNVYPPPTADAGDWTDTETRCAVGLGIPTGRTKAPMSR